MVLVVCILHTYHPSMIMLSPRVPLEIHTHTYVHTHAYVHTHTYVYTHTYVHTHTYVYTHAQYAPHTHRHPHIDTSTRRHTPIFSPPPSPQPTQLDLTNRPPLFYASINDQADPSAPPVYDEVDSMEDLKSTLEVKLAEYNESNPVMELVLFQQVCGFLFVILCLV